MKILAALEIVVMCWIVGYLAWATLKLVFIWLVLP